MEKTTTSSNTPYTFYYKNDSNPNIPGQPVEWKLYPPEIQVLLNQKYLKNKKFTVSLPHPFHKYYVDFNTKQQISKTEVQRIPIKIELNSDKAKAASGMLESILIFYLIFFL